MAKPQDASQTIAQELEHLARTKADAAWRLACGMLGNEADAEDALQQAFVIALSKAAEAPRPLPWPWFAMLLTNVCRNLRRRRKIRSAEPFEERLMSHESPNAPSDPAQAALLREDAQRAKKILARLNDDQREALSLTTLAGLTHAEAAEARGINLNTQKTQARRGMEALREEMGGSEARVVTALTAMPFLAPLGDLAENLVSLVQSTAETLVTPIGSGLTGTIAATTTTTTKVILMSKSLVATIAAVAGIAIGAAATVIALPGREETRVEMNKKIDSDSERELIAAKAAEAEAAKRKLEERDKLVLELREGFKTREAELQREIIAMSAESAAAKAERDAAVAADAKEAGPLELAHTKGMQWLGSDEFKVFTKEYLEFHRQYSAVLVAEATGGEITSEDNTKMQRTYEELERRYGAPIMLMMATLPSHSYDRFRATMNHPGLIAGLWTNWLEQADAPLTSSQQREMKALAAAFDKGWSDAEASYDGETLVFKKVADEWRLKQDFQDGYLAALNDKQRALIVDPALSGHIVYSRFSPIEVLNEYFVFSYDEARLLTQFKSTIQEQMEAPAGFVLSAEEVLKQFLLDAAPYAAKAGHQNERQREQIEKIIEIELRFLESLRSMTEDEEFKKRIQKFDRLFAPALLR